MMSLSGPTNEQAGYIACILSLSDYSFHILTRTEIWFSPMDPACLAVLLSGSGCFFPTLCYHWAWRWVGLLLAPHCPFRTVLSSLLLKPLFSWT